ncbi:collagen-like protein [Lactiplantibacillus plantarum]|uniref:collagen-like protein n=1 Tax=Lactiplantibacillus plantarum TaxID=1590 RepID=UPI0021AAB77B|nr:collagen-like protein [Lactiplantibacillus plantarum]MCT4442016.1 collagen-like protein [Lactiplantibacillus plantarum]MDN6015788.1 collagen-like protein [Lactiplantibacillus plantarum]MDP4437710.1 collagen-like protein [Lactiplantibacillus plantarum]MDP4440840.1 collagen-like protein [Lactiplantibacillus plantarum]MDP4459437.1 collagen-like protein [Lactiplantibacillus plantarum]
MAKTLSFTDTSPQTVKIGDTTTSFTLICGNDNVATDLTNATSITVKLGNASGYLKSATVNPASLTDPTTGQVTVKFNADLMTSLPAGSYAIEVWVVDSTGTSIYPSDGSTGFTITNNIQSANGATITTITFDDFVEAMNKAASTIAKGDKGDKGDTGTVDNAGLISAPAFQSLQTQVNNSAVGTNLLLSTGNNLSLTGKNILNQTTSNYLLANGYNVSSLASALGTQFTISYDWSVSGSSPSSSFSAQWNNAPWGSHLPLTTVSSSNASGHVSGTFSVSTDSKNVATMLGFRLDNFVGTLTISNVKLEKGSTATDWCPNPSEVLTKSDYAKIKAAIVALGGSLS